MTHDPATLMGLQIQHAADGSRAVIQIIHPLANNGHPHTKESLRLELKSKGIVSGIKWDVIEDTLKQLAQTQKPVSNLLVAEMNKEQVPVKLWDGKEFVGRREVENFSINLKNAFSIIKDEKEVSNDKLFFLDAGEMILTHHLSAKLQNIFGQEIKSRIFKLPFGLADSVLAESKDGCTQLKAKQSGYLVIDDKNRLMVLSPLETSDDGMALSFVYCPVSKGQAALDKLFRNKSGQEGIPQNLSRVTLNSGRAPEAGQDAQLIYHIERHDKPVASADDSVDYHEVSPFHQIKKGQLIAEKIPATEGKAGVDAQGKTIPAQAGQDIKFEAGENVKVSEKQGKQYFHATLDGVLVFKDSSCYVQDVLSVNSDVNSKTGNLRAEGHVYVNGDIKGGFTVESGGDLYVSGSIDNNAQVICRGNLNVQRGVFGEGTNVQVHGDAQVGFLQNTQMTVSGHLIVNKYIYDSRVICRKDLTVWGATVVKGNKGSVVGGCVNSVGSMFLHSVGSSMAHTHLICGVDAERLSKMDELEKLAQILKKKILATQSRIGFDLSDPKAGEKLASLPSGRKQKVREQLIQLKEQTAEREEVLTKIKALENSQVAAQLEGIKLEIQHQVIPNVFIEIGDLSKVIDQPLNKQSFQIKDDEIVQSSPA